MRHSNPRNRKSTGLNRKGAGQGSGKAAGQGRARQKNGRGNKRPLRHGDLKFLLLSLINDTPRHGYEIISEIENRTQGRYQPSPGVIYPALDYLLDLGWVTVSEENSKKSYAITPEGVTTLSENEARLEQINERLNQSAEATQAGDPSDIKIALQRLRHDIKAYVKASNVSDEAKKTIVEIVEQARTQVAKLS